MKKILILPICFLVITLVEIACTCKCDYNKDLHYFNIKSNGKLYLYKDNNTFVAQSQTITTDSLRVLAGFSSDCIAQRQQSLFTGAYAYDPKCFCPCGDLGLKNKIREIIYTASNNFDGIPDGNSLNGKVLQKYYSKTGVLKFITIQEYMDSLNASNTSQFLYEQSSAIIPTKPATPFNGKIKLAYIFTNNDTVSAETINFGWQ